MNEKEVGTIHSLATEISHVSLNILRRAGTVADSLGGSCPQSGSDGNAPAQTDLHSVLQRVLSTLLETQGEITRSEKVIGIPPSAQAPDAVSARPMKPQMGKTLHNY